MTEIEKGEQVLADLEDKRKNLNLRAGELADERGRIAFSAHADADPKARQRLNAINTETSTLASEQASIEAAITEANVRLGKARAAEASAADRAAALQLREALARFVELGLVVDEAFADIISASTEMDAVLNKIHTLGCPSPNANQMRVLGTLAVKTAVMGIPWTAKEWEHLAPNQRKSFKSIVSGWHDIIASNIAARLGETKQEMAA